MAAVGFFRLGDDGEMFAVDAEQDGRFDMQMLAAPLGVSVDRIKMSGLLVQCGEDNKSIYTLQDFVRHAQHLGVAEDGTGANPFVLSVGGVRPGKFDAIDAITSASSAAERCASIFDRQLFYDFRPAKALPLGIFVKAFAHARDVLAMEPQQISPKAWIFVRELREEMPAAFPTTSGRPDESRRQLAFTNCLRRYVSNILGPDFDVISNKEPSPLHVIGRAPDVKIYVRLRNRQQLLVAIIEVKPEIGFNGEPSLENLVYYSHHVSRSFQKEIYFTGYPMLLMELVGPNLRLAGAYYMDKPVYEPMTPFLSLLQLHDLVHLHQLGCMAMAIQSTLAALRELYLGASSRPKALRCEGALSWPYRIQELYPAANLQRLFAGKAIFRVTEGNRNRMVKFVQDRYGAEVHKQWASCGHAPDFELEKLQGSWLMITMVLLGRDDGWLNLDDLKEEHASLWDDCRKAVQDALAKVQSETETQMVHGDIRAPNIMYNVKTGQVMFIDFDWAGPAGRVFYPPLLNHRLQWPDGVTGNGPILTQHDQDAVRLVFS